MAEPQPPFPGADRIRSLTDQDSIFRAFDAYPWTKDSAFLSGLRAILGAPNPSNPQNGSLRDIATHARIFYYAQRIGVQIDFAAYQTWLSQHPEYPPPHIVPSEYEQQQSSEPASASSASATAWQQAAPKADLYVDRSAQSQASGEGGEPSYPLAFAEMIKLIQEGKPIPGIRQIPNTIERDPTVKPVGSRPVPRKPWEKEATATADTGAEGIVNALDLEFPPVEHQVEGEATAAATGSS
ncbi:uncharacterized protein TrAtP1_000436 [Trichoderma atroviride]|uniref:Uncharacterized protein n=1 Tax=Hypocrea atroviridis (strain ATCC 20476 / IMI 206040) TaxID=452589 RepID=G9NJB2_HYPAI|nr:uncharacterized protein TRIATDRAFT_213626 [Trichoderma atroviride IMI 206040]EHK48986.1 hypothetical protein TRIATDRAFT_213626 [Trichoderma atroviride IMI 206040]UKZ59118.1 hypothetical protein TrAtP1_000436 [Trichoderma atroviride]